MCPLILMILLPAGLYAGDTVPLLDKISELASESIGGKVSWVAGIIVFLAGVVAWPKTGYSPWIGAGTVAASAAIVGNQEILGGLQSWLSTEGSAFWNPTTPTPTPDP